MLFQFIWVHLGSFGFIWALEKSDINWICIIEICVIFENISPHPTNHQSHTSHISPIKPYPFWWQIDLVKSRKSKSLNNVPSVSKARYVVETITTLTTTTVTERRIVREAGEDVTGVAAGTVALATNEGDAHASSSTGATSNLNQSNQNQPETNMLTKSAEDADYPPPIPPKEMVTPSTASQISGILKGGKLWKQDSISQVNFNRHSLQRVFKFMHNL